MFESMTFLKIKSTAFKEMYFKKRFLNFYNFYFEIYIYINFDILL